MDDIDFIMCKIFAKYYLWFRCKRLLIWILVYSWYMKNEVKDFNTFGNITECLKTKVSVRMEWLGDFVLGCK